MAGWPPDSTDADWSPDQECDLECEDAPVVGLIQNVVKNTLAAVNFVARMEDFECRVEALETLRPRHDLLTDLAHLGLRVSQPIPFTVEFNGDDFIAQFMLAGISTTGDTQTEAVWNLCDIITLKFNRLCEIPENQLGAIPRRQLAVLQSFISKK